jgi:DNA-binding FadR family transcriptional regulator
VNVEDEVIMTAAETQDRTEIDRIEAWRAEELERAGYSADEASRLAGRHDIDLHRAVELIGQGCPPDIALRILL